MSQNYLPTRILLGRVIAYYEKVNNLGVHLRKESDLNNIIRLEN